MNSREITGKTIDETIEAGLLPPVLYKYRTWDNPKTKSILTDRQIFMSSPLKFDDPMDCHNFIDFEGASISEILEYWMGVAKRNTDYITDEELIHEVVRLFNTHPLNDLINYAIYKTEEEKKLLGILCLTSLKTNEFLWQSYAKNASGYCIGFDSKILAEVIQCGGGLIDYDYIDKLPRISPIDPIMMQRYKMSQVKLKKYEPEQEYRLIKLYYKSPEESEMLRNFGVKIELPKEAYKELILGYNISHEDESEILTIVKRDFPNIKIYRAVMKSDDSIEII